MKEREENLRLAAENDELKIQEHELKKHISILLKISGLTPSQFTALISEHKVCKSYF